MCLVEIEKIPKLQPSCATTVADGMVVRTKTPETLGNRRSVLEFLLLNHPLDCPVCDQAGECELQNYYMEHGMYDARFNENKTKRKKAFPIGPHVMLDQERCILCTRCVRFTREVSGTAELGVFDRGHRSEIDIYPGVELTNPYSGNVVDICPVGALTDRDFRFKCRVWFLGSSPSVCPGCSRGCNIEIHYNERFNARYHDRRVERLKPRFNAEVNGHWMCDEGRYAFHAIDAAERLKTPAVRDAEGFRAVSWDEAMRLTAAALRETLDNHGPEGAALVVSPAMTNEELFQMRRLFRDFLKVPHIEYRLVTDEAVSSDDFLITRDKNPNSRGAEILGLAGEGMEALLRACSEDRIHFLYICHHDLTRGFDPQQVASALAKVDHVIFHGSWDQATAVMAGIKLPAAVYAESEGTFTNFQGRVQHISAAVPPLGDSLPGLEIIAQLAARLEAPLPWASAGEVFQEIGRDVAAFTGLTYETVGSAGQLLT